MRWDDTTADGYAYSTFSRDDPSFFRLLRCEQLPDPLSSAQQGHNQNSQRTIQSRGVVKTLQKLSFGPSATSDVHIGSAGFTDWSVWGFHVGQGMCALLTDNHDNGILLDAGAGTPILRKDYLSTTTLMQNDLRDKLKHITRLEMVLSHADRDHWNLIAWDDQLRNKVQNIYLPDGGKAFSLALKDKTVQQMVRPTKGFRCHLSGGGALDILRSDPATGKKNDNTECLVAVYRSATTGETVLHAGDYVYEDMRFDQSPAIKGLTTHQFTAVVVPHHGDAASANDVFNPFAPRRSIAFFSAGNNDGYGHPTQSSRDAHLDAKFNEICAPLTNYIRGVKLTA